MDDLLELLCLEDRKRLRSRQFLHPTLLHLRKTTTNEHPICLLRPHTYRLQDFCRHVESWISCIMAPLHTSITKGQPQWSRCCQDWGLVFWQVAVIGSLEDAWST